MQFLGRNANFSSQCKHAAVGKAGGGIGVHGCRIDVVEEGFDGLSILRDNRLRMPGRIFLNVRQGFGQSCPLLLPNIYNPETPGQNPPAALFAGRGTLLLVEWGRLFRRQKFPPYKRLALLLRKVKMRLRSPDLPQTCLSELQTEGRDTLALTTMARAFSRSADFST